MCAQSLMGIEDTRNDILTPFPVGVSSCPSAPFLPLTSCHCVIHTDTSLMYCTICHLHHVIDFVGY